MLWGRILRQSGEKLVAVVMDTAIYSGSGNAVAGLIVSMERLEETV